MNIKLIIGIGMALMLVVMNPKNSVFAVTTNSGMVEDGRYLSKIAGCNDCHTPGYLLSGGKIPEESWLIGDRFGWRGPWGTTYAVNLRIFMSSLTEEQWISVARKFEARPPMPWYSVNEMREKDLRALYQFIRSFQQVGEPAHPFVPPGMEPDTPYALFPSPPGEGNGK